MDERVLELELVVLDLQAEVGRLREEVESLAKVANIANDEVQQAALRMDGLEHEWLTWGEVTPEGGVSSATARSTSSGPHTDGPHPTELVSSTTGGKSPAPFDVAGR